MLRQVYDLCFVWQPVSEAGCAGRQFRQRARAILQFRDIQGTKLL
jgi:hypothetical protein